MKKLSVIIALLFSLQFPNWSWGWFPFTELPSYEKFENRQKFANTLLLEVNKIYDAIPELSPKEKKWLETELENKNPQRKLKALASEEWKIKNTKQAVLNIKIPLKLIYEKNYKDLKQEMLLWLAVADGFLFAATASDLSALVSKKVIIVNSNNKYGDKTSTIFFGDFIAREILQKIIGPYLMEYKKEIHFKKGN